MRIDRLRLVNFRQHEDTEIFLGAGLTGIIGPNGSGKTTLLEAIAWALYGAPAARGSREGLRRLGAGPRAPVRVEVDFSLGQHHYRLLRSLNTAELYQDAEPAPLANSLAAVTERIGRMLGMTHEEFFNTYFTSQKELAVMSAMRPGERAQFLSRVLGYERLKAAQERLRETRSGLRSRLQALESGLPDPAELAAEEQRAADRLVVSESAERNGATALAEAEARLAEVRPRWEAVQQLQESFQALEGDLRLADHRIHSAREKFQGLDRQLYEANEARVKLEQLKPQLAPLVTLRTERQLLESQAEAYAARNALVAQLEEVRSRLSALQERMARIPTPETIAALDQQLQEIRGGLATAAAEAEERRTAWVRDAQDAKTKRETLLDQYQELKEQHQRIVDAGPAGVCPTCARPLGDEFDNVLGVLERQLQDVMFNGQFYKQRIEQLVIDPPELTALEQKRAQLEREAGETTARLVRLQAQAQDAPGLLLERARQESRIRELEERLARMQTTYDQARHREVRRLLDELEPLALQGERLRAAADRGEVLIREAEVAEKELSDREAAGGALRNRMATLGFSEESLRETRATFDRSEQGRREAELALVRARAEREAAEEARQSVARRRAERAAREEEARRTARDLELHNELDRALGDLRTDLNAQLRPDLSEIASAFLRELTNGRYNELDLDEDYVATIMDEGEPKPVISGGEEDISSLALRLAISQMIAERAGQPLSLLILDEVFGSLDEDHRQSVVDLLRSLADRFPQVILITHIESVRDGFDRVIRVEFDREKGTAMVRDEATGGVDGLAA